MRKKKQQELKKLDITEDELKEIKRYQSYEAIGDLLVVVILLGITLTAIAFIAGGLWQ